MKALSLGILFTLFSLSSKAQEATTNSNKKFRFLVGVGLQRNTYSSSFQGVMTSIEKPKIKMHARLGAEWYFLKNFFIYSGLEWMDKAAKPGNRAYEIVPVSSTSPKNYVIEINRSSFHYAQLAMGIGYLIPAGKMSLRPAIGILPSVLYMIQSETRRSQTFMPEPEITKNKNKLPFDKDLWWNGEFRIAIEPRNAYKHWGAALFYQKLLIQPNNIIPSLSQSSLGIQIYRWF